LAPNRLVDVGFWLSFMEANAHELQAKKLESLGDIQKASVAYLRAASGRKSRAF
jgi:hypothetical protein